MIRFILYSIFSSLARLFIDQQVKKHAGRIFELVDKSLPSAMIPNPPSTLDLVLKEAIMTATGLASVDERQVQQVRDLFDPVQFVKRMGK